LCECHKYLCVLAKNSIDYSIEDFKKEKPITKKAVMGLR
jgi:hypothetical protein